MKTFSYKCRDSNWAVKSGTIQANDRSEALRELKTKGYVPFTVTEGKSGPYSVADNRPWNIKDRVLARALLVLFFIAGGIWFLIPSKIDKKPNTDVVTAKKEKKVTVTTSRNEAIPKPVVIKPVATNTQPKSQLVESQPLVPKQVPSTATSEKIVPNKETPQPNPLQEQPERVYKTAVEQLISMLGLPGEEGPPLPITEDESLEEDFQTALTNVITVLDNEDHQSVTRKETVAWIKQFIKQGQAMGWTPGDYIRELEKKRKEEAALRQKAYQIMSEVENSEAVTDKETTKAIRSQINKELSDQGILPLEETEE